MCFYKAIVQSMFWHVSSENAPLVLILQSYSQILIVLTLPVPSLLVPKPDTKGGWGGSAGPPAILKTVALMNMKFHMVLETSLNILEI